MKKSMSPENPAKERTTVTRTITIAEIHLILTLFILPLFFTKPKIDKAIAIKKNAIFTTPKPNPKIINKIELNNAAVLYSFAFLRSCSSINKIYLLI